MRPLAYSQYAVTLVRNEKVQIQERLPNVVSDFSYHDEMLLKGNDSLSLGANYFI